MSTETHPTIAVLGGTGKEGGGLAYRWALAGYPIIIGSRSEDKALNAAETLQTEAPAASIRGMENPAAAAAADLIVLSVPYAAHAPTLESVREAVQGKVVIDVTVPMKPPLTVVSLPEGRTAAEEAQVILGDDVRIVSAFQNVSAVHLKDPNHAIDCDVLISGDDEDAKQIAIQLTEAAGMRGINVGALANAIVAESLTPLLIAINKRYGIKSSGIRITGIE